MSDPLTYVGHFAKREVESSAACMSQTAAVSDENV